MPGRQNIPPHAVVEHKIGTQPPAILSEESNVFVADVEGTGVTLLVSTGDAKQKISKVGACLRALEDERTVVDRIGFDIDLIEMEAAAELEGMVANHAGEIVAPLKGIVDLPLSGDIDTDGEVVEGNVLNTFNARVEGNNAEGVRTLHKALRGQAWPDAAHRLADNIEIPHIAEVRLVHHVVAKRPGQSETVQLRPPVGERIKTRYVGAALRGWIRIVQVVLVDEIISGEIAPPRVLVKASGPLVVAKGFIPPRIGEGV